jgi:hypothetical protein
VPLLLEELQEQLTNLVAGTDLHTLKSTFHGSLRQTCWHIGKAADSACLSLALGELSQRVIRCHAIPMTMTDLPE